MTAETFYGLKAGTLQLPWELGPCGYSSGAVMRLRRRDQEEKGVVKTHKKSVLQ